MNRLKRFGAGIGILAAGVLNTASVDLRNYENKGLFYLQNIEPVSKGSSSVLLDAMLEDKYYSYDENGEKLWIFDFPSNNWSTSIEIDSCGECEIEINYPDFLKQKLYQLFKDVDKFNRDEVDIIQDNFSGYDFIFQDGNLRIFDYPNKWCELDVRDENNDREPEVLDVTFDSRLDIENGLGKLYYSFISQRRDK